MRKVICSILCAVTVILSVFIPAGAAYDAEMEKLGLYSECLLLMSADNGEVIFAKNETMQSAPASLTKIVTACVVLENCSDLTAPVTVTEQSLHELDGTGSSLGGLKAGETLSLYDMLCCLLLQSANEAATTLANYVTNGDRAAFIAKMNELAERLGCTDSHFVNPHGLDDEDQYVSAENIAKFFKYALEFPAFAEIVGKNSYTLPATNMQGERTIHSTNFMLNSAYKDYYCKYVKGGKTGTTSQAGRCVVTLASNDGYNYIGVAMRSIFEDVDRDGVEENGAFLDCKKMFEWAFKNIRLVAVCDPEKIVAEIPVKYARTTDFVSLVPAETVYSLVPTGTDSGSLLIETIPDTVPESVNAPIKERQVICKGRVLYAGKVIREIDLVSRSQIKRSFLAFIGTELQALFGSWIFRIAAVAVLAALIVLLVLRSRRVKAKRSGSFRVLNYNDFKNLK